jgi:anti-sigma factor RsiW
MFYLDSEGDPELHLHINDHLGMCPACAEWFARQQRFEQALTERLAAGRVTPALWAKALERAGLPRSALVRRRWLLQGGLVAAAVLLAAGIVWLVMRPAHSHDLPLVAAEWHQQLLHGDLKPEFVSQSSRQVDRYLKKRVPFRVHCPPAKDVDFYVNGAGVRTLNDRQQAAYIVGQVRQARVSILVLDRAALDDFPLEKNYLLGGKRHRCREGKYQMVSGIFAENVVIVIGAAPAEDLEKLFNAYGSYHTEA